MTAAPGRGTQRNWRSVFVAAEGLRAGWCLLLFWLLYALLAGALNWTAVRLLPELRDEGWTARALIVMEADSALALLAALAVMVRLERRPLAAYGLAGRLPAGRMFWEGALWGALSIALVMLLIAAAGGYSVSGLAMSGGAAVAGAAAFALATLLIGVTEEVLFRGYSLATLTRGLGFWPAALLLSWLFGALHYYLKPMESWMDGLSVTLIGLFFCLTVRVTGSIWLAAGWHFTYNYGSFFVFGGPNTGNDGRPLAGHLLRSTFDGPAWLTGGPAGPEASAFIFVVIVALFVALRLRFRERPVRASQA